MCRDPKPIQGASFNFHEVGKARGGFPLTLNLHVRTHANFTRVNKIEAMYGKSRVNVKVERGSTFFFSHVLASIYFISASKIYVHTHVKIT